MKKILILGDIVGRPGRSIIHQKLRAIREQHQLDFVIANGENAAGGAGLTKALAHELLNSGIDGITLGNHVWDQQSLLEDIDQLPYVSRPANLPKESPGKPYIIIERGGFRIGILTVLGRVYMDIQAECPFRCADVYLKELQPLVDACIVEIHAEATAEKQALGWYLDGRVNLVFGTHTHVATADAKVLNKGTAYITDIGMTGAHESILGASIEPIIKKFITSIPRRFSVAENDVQMNGCILTIHQSPEPKNQLELYRYKAVEL